MNTLRAGAARVLLEPPLGLEMMGYGSRVGRARGVNDPLAAQAIVCDDGSTRIALCGVDLLAIGKRIADDIRARVARQSKISADAILIGATHTHSAPFFNIFATPQSGATVADSRDPQWERALPEKIASAILAADDALEPASLKAASARFVLGTNRRLRRADGSIQLAANYSGVAESEAQALGFYRADGSAIAFLINYPCHGVVLCEDNLLYSRDWMGFAIGEIERLASESVPDAPKPPVAVFMQGTTGNIDPRSRGSFEVARAHGATLGRDLLNALNAAPFEAPSNFQVRRVELKARLKPLDDALAIARECLSQTQASLENHRGGEGYQLKRLRDHHQQSEAALMALEALVEANRRDKRVDLARGEMATGMTVASLGEIAIVGLPGEAFVEFGLALRANPYFARTLVACYCNDLIGYIPTREAYPLGGYEVETARVAKGTGESMVAAALGLMREFRASSGSLGE